MRPFCHFVILCLLFALPGGCLWAAPPAPPPPSLQVSGAVIRPGAWDAARLRRNLAPSLADVNYTLKGKSHKAHAVPLLALLQSAGPRFNPKIKNHRIQFVVLVRGRDGYTAAFSLAELSPDLGGRAVWLALDEDGRPFAADAGPAQLLVTGDARPARWVHGVGAVVVRDEASASGGL